MRDESPTLLFDSECLICLGSVRFIAARDGGRHRFGALKSQSAKNLLASFSLPSSLDSAILIEGNQVYLRSEAVLRILSHLKGWRWLAAVLGWIPRRMRDAAYDFVARHRARFSRTERCDLPSPELRSRII